ncbi:hypothetical protein HELRODRAFT_99632, partial [Helobdella robusta]|uniref:Histone-lysine N-methyltransferase n=1 Tax=Helobdella robusta TaxID=6412 RepID=T1G9U2_HELRO
MNRWNASLIRPPAVQKVFAEKEAAESLEAQGTIIRPKLKISDSRSCVLCKVTGDAYTNGPGRLLLLNVDKWVHLNCALWSYEVYETMNGSLMNVEQACRRGTGIDCIVCRQSGATIACFRPRCANVYHLDCAIKDEAVFYQDKTILCRQHATRSDASSVLTSLSVFRRVYVNRDEEKQVARTMQHEERKCVLRLGGVVVHNLGQLLLHQIQSGLYNNADYIYPVGFKSSRFYWSYRQTNKRCRYLCKIDDGGDDGGSDGGSGGGGGGGGGPVFSVVVFEKGFEQTTFKDSTCKGVWSQILTPLEKMRRENDLVKIFPLYLSGEDLFGLGEPTIVKLVESLPSVELLPNYNFKFGRTPLYKLPLAVNPSGCARTEPKLRMHFKRPHALHGSNSSSGSRNLQSHLSMLRSSESTPYLKQFAHSKTQQYRRLKTEWRNNVYLRRSNIQGLGLFAARELEKHTMVIEYIGQLIRAELAEKREKIYEKSNHGVYMFRIENTNLVVDATMSGGPARYINHSCNPNCVAEMVPFEKEKDNKIIIITKRKIAQGEELCYDYKFDLEDDQHKIPCLCGAPNCRKWMN